MRKYAFSVTGTAADGQTWETEGTVECPFDEVFGKVNRQSFQQLTAGKAVFGKPGVGCSGPYQVKTLLIERVDE